MSYPWDALGTNLWITAIVTVVVFAVALGVAVGPRRGRHDGIDVVWGLSFAVIAVTTLVASTGHGDDWRRWLITALTCIWGVRLGTHILLRNRGTGEDPRYVAITGRAKGSPTAHLVRKVYVPQAVIAWVVSLPVQLGQYGFADDALSVIVTVLGVASWVVGFTFETVGDAQLSAFKRDPANAGQVMDRGLWRYTRHPNYFGDAAVWWGLTLLTLHHLAGLIGLVSAALMTWLLAKGTGAALLERTIGNRRPGYVDYVRRTSGFLPLPPEEAAAERARIGRTTMKTGDRISDFTLQDETGTERTLSALLENGPVALFFYPIASSGGCTQEACHFRDLAAEFAALGAQRVGISGDPVAKQQAFASTHSLGYPLLSDTGHAVAKELGAYRAWLRGGLHTRRLTFVIDTDRTLIGSFGSETKFDQHADEALEILRRKRSTA